MKLAIASRPDGRFIIRALQPEGAFKRGCWLVSGRDAGTQSVEGDEHWRKSVTKSDDKISAHSGTRVDTNSVGKIFTILIA